MAIQQTTGGRRVSLAEFLELPETTPASELIDGQIVQKPLAKMPHSLAQSQALFALATHPATRDGLALPELGANLGDDHRVPDISWFAPRRLTGIRNYPSFPPDLAAEVRSDGQTRESQRDRLAFYRARGTIATLLIDPLDRTVEVHDGERTFIARTGETMRVESVGGFELPARALFDT